MTSEERGIHVDLSLDRRFLLALLDVVPPGVDEIFATFGILELLKENARVVIDMAPTGHALEVLRTPERLLAWARVLLKTLAAHRTLPIARDAGVEIAKLSQRVRELSSILRDSKRCQIVTVTLAELLPDYETRRLLESLRELQAPLGAVFVNRVRMDGGGVSQVYAGKRVAGSFAGSACGSNWAGAKFTWCEKQGGQSPGQWLWSNSREGYGGWFDEAAEVDTIRQA